MLVTDCDAQHAGQRGGRGHGRILHPTPAEQLRVNRESAGGVVPGRDEFDVIQRGDSRRIQTRGLKAQAQLIV